MTSAPSLPRPLRVAGVVCVVVLAVFLAAMVVAIVWVGVRGAIAADYLRSAKDSAADVVANIADPAAAASGIDDIAADTASARELTSDPVWSALELTPWLGPQLVAVGTVAQAADDVASNALQPLAEVASTLSADAFRPAGGKVELSGFVAVQDAAARAAAAMETATASLDTINTTALLGPLRAVIDEVTATFEVTNSGTRSLANASLLLPAMLGQDGPRNYLVLFQNNAEWRSLGGIAGAMVMIHTDGGSMKIGAVDAGNNFPRADSSVIPLSDEILAIYGQRPGQWMQNVTQVPDFEVSARIAHEMWTRKHGIQVDGVIAMDPVALSYILGATGPVALPNGDSLQQDTAVETLLNGVYLRYADPVDQDRYFADATSAVFETLASGAADPSTLLAALAKAGDERRFMIWSADPAEQNLLADTTLAGGLPVTDSTSSAFGVFLNDGTGSKLDYYMSAETEVGWESCSPNSSGTVTGTASLRVTLTSHVPADAATLPDYVTAAGWFGVPVGSARTVAYLYLPEGFDLVDATMSNGSGFSGGTHEGRRVLSFDVVLAPGESVTATVSAASDKPSGATLIAQVTPTVYANVTSAFVVCGS